MDQLYSRTETPDAGDAVGVLQQEASGGGEEPVGILSSLPHRRAHRRSALRSRESAVTPVARAPVAAAAGVAPPPTSAGAAGAGASAVAAQAVAVVDPAEARHLHAVGDPGVSPAPAGAVRRARRFLLRASRPRALRNSRSTARSRRPSSRGESPPSWRARPPVRSQERCAAEHLRARARFGPAAPPRSRGSQCPREPGTAVTP